MPKDTNSHENKSRTHMCKYLFSNLASDVDVRASGTVLHPQVDAPLVLYS